MASWVKSTIDNSTYFQINMMAAVAIHQDPNDNQWYITCAVDPVGQFLPIKGPYATQQAAQTALDNAIVQLGGSI